MDNQRLILFIVFSFSLLLLWEAWQDKHAPPPAVTATSATSATTSTPPAPSQALKEVLPVCGERGSTRIGKSPARCIAASRFV